MQNTSIYDQTQRLSLTPICRLLQKQKFKRLMSAGEFPENTGHVQLSHVLWRHPRVCRGCAQQAGRGDQQEGPSPQPQRHQTPRSRPQRRCRSSRGPAEGTLSRGCNAQPCPQEPPACSARRKHGRLWDGRRGSAGTHTHGLQLSPLPTQMAATPWKAGPAASSEHSSPPSTRLPGTLCEGW